MPEFQTKHSVFEYIQTENNPKCKPLLMINIDLCTSKEEFEFIRMLCKLNNFQSQCNDT